MLPVALLAGGIATRLRPVTEKIPKSLVEINGEPFLAHQLRLLRSRGIERVVLCAGYLGEAVRDFAGDGLGFGIQLQYSFDGPMLRGTGGAIHQALPLLGERFLVVYGDSYLPCDYRAAANAFEQSGKLGMMTVYRNQGQWDSSNVEFTDGRIVAYDKRNRTPRMHYIDYGLGAFRREAFDGIAPDAVCDLADIYRALLSRDELAAVEQTERFYEIGSFAGIEDLSNALKSGALAG
ncbi:MAG TPA: nucleotidyltransferase family protein [Bryobacteraceae bacterium]|jgi:NDP-sugar pyrophosphorylase family protein